MTFERVELGLRAVVAIALALSMPLLGQNSQTTGLETGTIMGTVTDVNGDTIPNATVALEAADGKVPRTIVTPADGLFQFQDVKPGIPYQLSVSAKNFAEWTSLAITLDPGQFKIVTGIQLRIQPQRTSVDVHYDPVEVATEQFKAEEQQRVFGIIPSFYVSYESDPEPLTAKMKFCQLRKFQQFSW